MAALELNMKIWQVVKIALILIASVGAISDTSYTEIENEIGWEPVIVGLLLFPTMVVVGLFVLKVLFGRTLNFESPSLRSNPLDFSHPEHFLHLAGLIMLVSGVCGLVAGYFRSGELTPIIIVPAATGIGIMVGIHTLSMVHAAQGESSNKQRQSDA
jgi:hypothetical protein